MPRSDVRADLRADLLAALVAFDEDRVVELLDGERDRRGVTAVVRDLLLPVMREVGLGWERAEVSVAQEHLATQVVRAYLGGLGSSLRVGDGPQVWLACPPRELHDLPLLAFGVLLRERGWRVRFFGASTPLHDLLRTMRLHHPEVVVVSADSPARLRASSVVLDLIAGETTLALGGRAAEVAGAELSGVVLPADVVLAADRLKELLPPAEPASTG
ncbi:B12-binding domain-containing protein [Ornithinimicrobium sp. LYQ103]|uniref:cobalamin B12-binding domain-containing protein n=1 Tax=Ornithinimicrobium sp. LYQ103 TaxID=3378796 RepID=UPI003853FE0D